MNNNTLINSKALREEVKDLILNEKITIISADTGSGKTIAVSSILSKLYNKVVVTQPRIPNIFGAHKGVKALFNVNSNYFTALYRKDEGHDLSFVTDGYLAHNLTMLRECDVLVIDEIHEFNIYMEELLYYARLELKRRDNFKLVILSATIKEQINKIKNYYNEYNVAYKHFSGTTYDIEKVNFDNYEEISVLDAIKRELKYNNDMKVFLPTIDMLYEIETNLLDISGIDKYEILRLSRESEDDVRNKLFEKGSKPRIWLATNIAQTGITPINLKTVIVSGYKVEENIDSNGIESVSKVPLSKDDVIQQIGRCGRMSDGKAIWAADYPYQSCPEHSTPQVQRTSLDRLYLSFMERNIALEKIEILHNPSNHNVKLAKKSLEDLYLIDNGVITELGKQCVKLPLQPKFAKAIIISQKYGLENIMIRLMAIMEYNQPILKREFNNRDALSKVVQSNFISKISDIFTYYNLIDSNLANNSYDNILNKNSIRAIGDFVKMIKRSISIRNTESDRKYLPNALCESFYKNLWKKVGDGYENVFTNEYLKVDNKMIINSYNDFVLGFPKKIMTFQVLSNVINLPWDVIKEVYHKEIKKNTVIEYNDNEKRIVKWNIEKLFGVEINRTEIDEHDSSSYIMFINNMSSYDPSMNKKRSYGYTKNLEKCYHKTSDEKYLIPDVKEHFEKYKIYNLERYNLNPYPIYELSDEELNEINTKYPDKIGQFDVTYIANELPIITVYKNVELNIPETGYRYKFNGTVYNNYNEFIEAYNKSIKEDLELELRNYKNSLKECVRDFDRELEVKEFKGISLYPCKRFCNTKDYYDLYYIENEEESIEKNNEFNEELKNYEQRIIRDRIDSAKRYLLKNVVLEIQLEELPEYKCEEITYDGILFYAGYKLINNRGYVTVDNCVFETIDELDYYYDEIKNHYELQKEIEIKREEFYEKYSHVSDLINNIWSSNKRLARDIQSCYDRTLNQIFDGDFDTSELDELLSKVNKIDYNENVNNYSGNDVIRFSSDRGNNKRRR